MTNQVMKLLCAAVLLMAFSVTAFPEPDVTELKINVEVSIRPHLVAALWALQALTHLCSFMYAAQAQGLLAHGLGWRHS